MMEIIQGSTQGTLLLTNAQLAELMQVSTRHLRRLADSGKMPKAIRLGSSIRWNRGEIEAWLAAGCPDCRRRK